MRKIKIQSILAAVAGLFLATSCSSSFLDTDPTDAVSSEKVPVPENAAALVNGAWYNLFDYSSTYANIGYRALQCLDDMMASDIVSRPKYGFNSSYQFNDIALPSNNRTEFAWYLIYKTIDNCKLLFRPEPPVLFHVSTIVKGFSSGWIFRNRSLQ